MNTIFIQTQFDDLVPSSKGYNKHQANTHRSTTTDHNSNKLTIVTVVIVIKIHYCVISDKVLTMDKVA